MSKTGQKNYISYKQGITEYKKDHSYYLFSIHVDYYPVANTSLETETYDQEFTQRQHREGVSPWNYVESFTIEGTSSGQVNFEDSFSGKFDYHEFRNGRIYFDANTNKIAGMSEAICTSTLVSIPTHNHGWMLIDYNGVTNFEYGVNLAAYNKTIVRTFNAPHTMYSDNS